MPLSPHTYANVVRPSQALAAPILNLHAMTVVCGHSSILGSMAAQEYSEKIEI